MPLYLVMGTSEFDYERKDLPPSVHYVGACLWDKLRHEKPSDWLDKLPKGQPWVHASEGTVHVVKPFVLSATAQGLANLSMQVILTTGGTGVAERDVTPEAIREIMRVEIPGFGEAMRAQSMKITPNAILSRSLAAIVDSSLVIALPGKPSGAVECLGFVEGAIPHSVALAQRKPTSC
jgi:molybdopterin adenylyltransferase